MIINNIGCKQTKISSYLCDIGKRNNEHKFRKIYLLKTILLTTKKIILL